MLQVTPTTYPYLFRWQQQRGGFDHLPDAVTDTTAKRHRKANRLFGDGNGILCRLLGVHNTQLFHLVVSLPTGTHLYWDAPALIRQELATYLGKAAHYVKLAMSRSGRVHAHIVAALKPEDAAQLPTYERGGIWYSQPIETERQLRTLAQYLSKPSLEGASRTRPVDLARYSATEIERQVFNAAEFYLQRRTQAAQRGLKQLPRLTWTTQLPYLKPDPISWQTRLFITRSRLQKRPQSYLSGKCWLSNKQAIKPANYQFLLCWPLLPHSRAPPVPVGYVVHHHNLWSHLYPLGDSFPNNKAPIRP